MDRPERLKLIVIKGPDEGKQFELSGPLVSIGRDTGNTIRLNDTEVSRRHAEVFADSADGRYALRDIGSANGTYVNKEQVTRVALQPGDQIQLGQSVLVYSGGRGDSAPSDLAEQISLITRQDVELSSAIIKTIAGDEGSRILSHPEKATGPLAEKLLTNLGIMYELSQAVSHILDLGELLNRVLELIFRSLEADRGCVLLKNPDGGQFQPKAVRWRLRPLHPSEKLPVSRTIVEYVLRERQGILVSDAMRDERFATTQSIVRQGIREVICVPMKGRHETLGVLYLDTHSAPRDFVANADPADSFLIGKFGEDSLALAIAMAHQAALAVEETRYHEALVQAERLAAVGQTIAALSHHIKNILQGLRSGGEIIKEGLADDKADVPLLQQGWKIVEKNQSRIYDLVMDMLSFSKERVPAIEDMDLNEVVREVIELVRGKAESKGVKLEAKLAEMPLCQADAEGIHRALLNVVSNALDAVDDRKNPHVAVGTMLEPAADVRGPWAKVVVVDNGVGIPTENLPELFKPFSSTKGARGTGLGLAVSRKVLREHGGDILVQSQVGKGSRFILRLPVRSPLSSDSINTSPEFPPIPG